MIKIFWVQFKRSILSEILDLQIFLSSRRALLEQAKALTFSAAFTDMIYRSVLALRRIDNSESFRQASSVLLLALTGRNGLNGRLNGDLQVLIFTQIAQDLLEAHVMQHHANDATSEGLIDLDHARVEQLTQILLSPFIITKNASIIYKLVTQKRG